MMSEENLVELKRKIKRKAHNLGANLVGVANVERWETEHHNAEEYWPQNIWPWSKSVIVLAVQIFPSMLETTPSVVYSELYNTTNRFLDEVAYRLANYINTLGHRAHFFPRDCYGDISVLVKKPEAAFSHVLAGLYAGLGTVGMNHTLLTKEYGPRIRLVSVITDLELPPDSMLKKELCVKCQACALRCPMQAFTPQPDTHIAKMDKQRCAAYHAQLKGEFRYPCGLCNAVCPIGKDKKLYKLQSVTAEGIEHCQAHGSANAVKDLPDPQIDVNAILSQTPNRNYIARKKASV